MNNNRIGWVYLMRNASMPRLMKIGFTMDDPWERANQLSSSTSVPTPFVVIFAQRTRYPAEVEAMVHSQFSERRVSSQREFFYTRYLIWRDEHKDQTHYATEEEENQYWALRVKYAAKLVAAQQRYERARLEVRNVQARCDCAWTKLHLGFAGVTSMTQLTDDSPCPAKLLDRLQREGKVPDA